MGLSESFGKLARIVVPAATILVATPAVGEERAKQQPTIEDVIKGYEDVIDGARKDLLEQGDDPNTFSPERINGPEFREKPKDGGRAIV